MRKDQEAGFTLVEVLVAFAIFVTGFVLVAAGFSRHLEVVRFLDGFSQADRLAQRELIQALLRREMSSPLAGQGQEGAFSWEVSLKVPPAPAEELQQAVSRVSWSFRNQSRSLEVLTGLAPSHEETP